MSNRRAALVGAAGMKERKRGLSHDTTAVASSWSKISNWIELNTVQNGREGESILRRRSFHFWNT